MGKFTNMWPNYVKNKASGRRSSVARGHVAMLKTVLALELTAPDHLAVALVADGVVGDLNV